MKLAYDLHIHSCLSPCASDDMTPNNIVNMSLLKGLDIIAVTDHNSVENIQAVMKVAEDKDIIIIPGMELETAEEIHMICLFQNLQTAQTMQDLIQKSLSYIKIRENIFGQQLVLNDRDEIVEKKDNLLSRASRITIEESIEQVKRLGGVIYPAHIDRESYSIMSSFGIIPKELGLKNVELSMNSKIDLYTEENPWVKDFNIIQSSDAHYLQLINEREYFIDVDYLSSNSIINSLNSRN